MVKTVKQLLKIQYNELNTLLIEIEAIVNALPLAYVEDGET